MSVQAIQNFLNAQVPDCDTSGSQTFTAPNGQVMTHAQWGAMYDSANNTSIGAAPYVCLENYVENPSNGQNNLQNPSATIPWGQSAAQIIYNAAQAYNINPQVILTTLQKEQGLVTDNWPWTNEYTEAMGYNCPDSGGCSGYAGLFQQVNAAAKQYRNYLNNPNNFNYVVGNNNIEYAPGCSSSTVNIQNQATAALYDYTPYQPSSAVLANTNPTGSNNGPGGSIGGSCNKYGNRNFWWYFNTWFGSSLTSGYTWQPVQQTMYTDSSESTPIDGLSLLPGQRFYVVLVAENIGSVTWQKGVAGQQVNLGTDNPHDHSSWFCDSSWLNTNCNRPATTNESSVAPGQDGTFGFWMTASTTPGTYNEYFNLVMDGTSWFNDPGLYWTFKVKVPSWQPIQQNAYTDNTMSTSVNTTNLGPNQRYYLYIKALNTGSSTWQVGVPGRQVNVGTDSPRDRASAFCDSWWLNTNCNRPATTNESSVAPGQDGTFGFWITTPNITGTYNEYYNLVMDGTSWFNDPGLYWTLRVNPAGISWQPAGQSLYTDNTMSTPLSPTNITSGQRFYAVLQAVNNGNVPWQVGVPGRQVNVGTDNPRDRASVFCDSSWLNTNCNRPATTTSSVVKPGQTATFDFWMTAPTSPGTYNEYYNLVMDGTSWSSNDPGLYWTLRVN
jgi:hypothetical protein